jgi:acyl carrier protein
VAETLEDIEQFVLGYLPQGYEEQDLAGLNFVDSGLLDSFGILSMVMDIESRFSVKLTPAELLNDDSKTVGGLARLIASKCVGG